MRVMLFTDTYPPQVNGVASCVNTLARSLSEHGHSVMVCTVLARHARANQRTHLSVEESFPVVRTRAVTIPLYGDIRIAAPVNLAIRRLVRSFRPDVIHCHTPFSIGWQGVQVCNAYHIPLIGTHHTLFGEYVGSYSRLGTEVNARLARWVRRYVAAFYNQCDLTTSASRFLAHDLIASGLDRQVMIVHNPVDTQRFHPLREAERQRIAPGGPRLVYFGRIAAEKNLHQLITLVEPFLRRHPAASFEIIGDGPARGGVMAFAQQRGLEHQVCFPGWMRGEALARRVASADICVSASLTENQPVSLLESFACGVPVVALAAAGVPEIVVDGFNGYLIAPGDTSDRFAERLESLTSHPALLRRMRANARATAAQYSREACLETTLAAYRETIAEAAHQREQRSARWMLPAALQHLLD